MFENEVLIYSILSIFLCIINIYNLFCIIGLFIFKGTTAIGSFNGLKFISKLNVYKQIIAHSKKVKNASSGRERAKVCHKKSVVWIYVSLVIWGLISLLTTVTLVMLITYSSLNIITKGAASVVQMMHKEECTCYARCTGDFEDDSKTAYELLFGKAEYQNFITALNLEPQYSEELQHIHDGVDKDGNSTAVLLDMSGEVWDPEAGDDSNNTGASRRRKEDGTLEPTGKVESEYIIEHFKSTSIFDTVGAYKSIINSSGRFRPGDHKDRKNMTDEELQEDLVNLLSDYKEFGRNPQCPVCNHAEDIGNSTKCLGGNHWVPGWTWDEIWKFPWDDQPEEPDDDDDNDDGEWDNGAEDSIYGVELDDGWYYWYHQSSPYCGCVNCGTWSQTKWGCASPDVWKKFGSDGCAVYSLAIGVSNLVGEEITPEVVQSLFGTTRDSEGKWITKEPYFSGQNGRSISRSKATEKLASEYGLKISSISKSEGEEKCLAYIDSILDQGGYVWAQWEDSALPEWCGGTSQHFMMIRKRSGDNYYCFTSCAGQYSKKKTSTAKGNAIHTMNTPVDKHKVYKSLSGYTKILFGLVGEHKKKGGTEGYKDITIQEINLGIPGASGSFVWASDLHMMCDADKKQGLLNRKKAFTGDEGFNYESILNQICNYADEKGMALVLGGDIMDYASDANIEAYKRATKDFSGQLYYIQADHDKNKTSIAGIDISDLCTKSDSEISGLKGTFGNVAEYKLANSRIVMFNNTIVDGEKYSFNALGGTDVALFHTPFDYGDMRVADETRKHGHDKNYAWNSKAQYLVYTEGKKAADIRDKTSKCGGSVSGHVHPSSLVTIKDIYPNGGLEAITAPAYKKVIYKVNLGGSGGSGGGGNMDKDIYEKLKAGGMSDSDAKRVAYVYAAIQPKYGSQAALALAACSLCEGQAGQFEGLNGYIKGTAKVNGYSYPWSNLNKSYAGLRNMQLVLDGSRENNTSVSRDDIAKAINIFKRLGGTIISCAQDANDWQTACDILEAYCGSSKGQGIGFIQFSGGRRTPRLQVYSQSTDFSEAGRWGAEMQACIMEIEGNGGYKQGFIEAQVAATGEEATAKIFTVYISGGSTQGLGARKDKMKSIIAALGGSKFD